MDKELFQKALGKIAVVDVAFREGAIVAEVKIPLMELVKLGSDKLKAAIPGGIDDAIIDLVVKTLEAEIIK